MDVILTVFVLMDNYTECVDERIVNIRDLYSHYHVIIKKYGTSCKIVSRPID